MLAAVWPLAHADAQAVHVAGSTTVRPFVAAAAKVWMRQHPEVMVLVRGGGSGAGLALLLEGKVDAAMMSRPPTSAELARLRKAGASRHVVGRDLLVLAVSDEIFHAGVHALSKAQVRGIWEGRIGNWKSLGGPDRPVLTAGRIVGSGTEGVFSAWLWGEEKSHPAPMIPLVSNRYVRNLLEASDQAIAYLPLGWTNERVHPLALKTDRGVLSAEDAKAGKTDWPMARDLVVWLRKDASSQARAFVEFLLSPEARPLLERAGYLPPRP